MSVLWVDEPEVPRLKAPPAWWALSEEERQAISDEAPCGPGNGALAMLVPDDILGVDIRLCCAVHDFRYRYWSKGVRDKVLAKRIADEEYLSNLLFLVGQKKDAKHIARIVMCYFHYWFVKYRGRLPT